MKALAKLRAIARQKHDCGEMTYTELQLILLELEKRKRALRGKP